MGAKTTHGRKRTIDGRDNTLQRFKAEYHGSRNTRKKCASWYRSSKEEGLSYSTATGKDLYRQP